MAGPLQSRSPRLPSVAESGNPVPELWLENSRQSSARTTEMSAARSRGTHVRLRDGSAPSRSTMTGSLRRSEVSIGPDSSFHVSDLNNYAMTDQRWTLQRKKIGLKRRTMGTRVKQERNRQTKDINISYILSHFTRKECLRYVCDPEAVIEGACHCGLMHEDHIPLTQLLRPSARPRSTGVGLTFKTVMEDPESESEKGSITTSLLSALPFGDLKSSYKKSKTFFKRKRNSLAPLTVEVGKPVESQGDLDSIQTLEEGLPNMRLNMDHLLQSAMIQPRQFEWRRASSGTSSSISRPPTPTRIPPVDSEWTPETHYRHFPTNSFGTIQFVNESTGSNKPAKYVRMADDTDMSNVLTFLADYWRLLDPHRPQLVISVTGGAKNFKLDGKKKEIFSSGLLKAVKSTNAWILTGGMHVGAMKSVGDVVNQGQYIVKVKRKTFFAEEKDHMMRGIRCLGVVPWGYIKDRETLINEDINDFSHVMYKVQEKVAKHGKVSLNGDHTHFLFIDNGSRDSFKGSDDFRTRLEEAIQMGEPRGFGVPVVMLLLEGGISSVNKCAMALKRNIPIVVVAGTGRAADLLAYAVTMTVRTPSGRCIMRKGHRAQLRTRVALTMMELAGQQEKQKSCVDMLIECCTKPDLITIFDINSTEAMDKYILYALLAGGGSNTSRLDQLNLALLWNRPDIAEQQIFPAQQEWPSGALEDLMTTALLDEKVEFVNLLLINGLVMRDYLTVCNLRDLYNKACDTNSHLAQLLKKCSHLNHYYLANVHYIIQAMIRQHNDPIYLADTPEAFENDSTINYLTFQDPYQELLLWAIFSRRVQLARYLWERCDTPLISAIVASAIYQSLWRSLGAKNTDIREEYKRNQKAFETLACELMEVCYQEDVINAMGLVERRSAKWGNMDCLEVAAIANDILFISTPCAQASIELSWRRGMVKSPFYMVILANIFPLLIFWRKFFRFQRLGDNGGELSAWQKLFVFYKSPISKFYGHSTSFVIFLLLYSYVVLFDFGYEISLAEKLVICWLLSFMVEEVAEIIYEQSSSVRGKIADWLSSVWNRFDLVSLTLASMALGLRMFRSTYKWSRIAYALNTTVFYCRLFRMYHVNYHLGPKLVIFNRMIREVMVFMALLVIFILGYGIASQGLLHPTRDASSMNVTTVAGLMEDILLVPYWQMYGELLLDELEGDDTELCHKPSCIQTQTCDLSNVTQCLLREDCLCENAQEYTWVVSVLLFFYLIIGNIMLLNLLIAIFTYVFEEVQQNSMEIWKFEMYRLIQEFDLKPGLVPPFVILEYFWRICKKIWKVTCRKKKENLEEFMKDNLDTMKIFEKEAIMTFASNLALAQEESIDNRIKRMSEKVEKISKYIEQKEDLEEIEDDLEWVIGEPDNITSDTVRKSDIISEQKKRKVSLLRKPPSPLLLPSPALEGNIEYTGSAEEFDIIGEELSNDDIERELLHLRETASVAGGEFTPFRGLSRPTTAFGGNSRPITPSLKARRGLEQLDNLSLRLDDLEQQVRSSNERMENLMNTIIDRIENPTNRNLSKKKGKR